ncbi:MAG TPA: hypothetical protein VFB33_00465 [Candidatus Binataceae bacterium]|nr:hypothetical protein [Candidatus Binataceae bacterium]
MTRRSNGYPTLRRCAALIFAGLLGLGCGSGGAFGIANPTAPGNTSGVPNETIMWLLGTPGTPFQVVVSDASASWTIKGVVPQSIIIINPSPPVQMVATKLSNRSTLLSAEIIRGVTLVAESSTYDAFGTVTLATTGGTARIAPQADPDVRFFVKAPLAGLLTGLIEDLSEGFVVQARSPVLFLFENPDGRVDGQFSSLDLAGTFAVDIIFNGAVVRQATGGPNLVIKYP